MSLYISLLELQVHTVLISVTALLLVAWWSSRLWQAPVNLPPGPWGWPILGYLPNLGINLYRTGMEPYRMFAQMSGKYGEVYSLYMGTKLVVILNGYDSIHEAFHNPHLNDRPKFDAFPASSLGVVMSSGRVWHYQRRFTKSSFRKFGIGKSSFQDKIFEETKFLLQELAFNDRKAVDPSKYLSNVTLNVICSVVFGKRFHYSDKTFQLIMKILDQQAESAGNGCLMLFVPIFRHFTPGSIRTSQQAGVQMQSFIQTIVAEHKKKFDISNLRDYIDVFLAEIELASKNNTDESFNEANLFQTIGQLFIAGVESTFTTLRWCILFMMGYPEIQSRIQQEIDSVVGRNRLPNISDNLPFTEATIMEVQRYATLVPLGMPHAAAEDSKLLGYAIPKGTVILANLWAVHHDPNVWTDPEQFRPQRFLDMNGKVLRQRNGYIPFSTGLRKCLGDNLAKMELFIVFTHLLHQFTVKKPPDVTKVSFEGTLGVAYAPKPFQIVAIKRN